MTRKSRKILTVFATSMLLLAACGDGESAKPQEEETVKENNGAVSSTEKEQNNKEEVTDTTSDSKEDSKPSTEQQQNTSSKEPVTSNKEEAKPETNQTSDKNNSASTDKKNPIHSVNPIYRDFLQFQLKSAHNGMTEGVEIESGKSVYEDVIKAYGKPTTEFSNDTNYVEYAKNGKVQYAFAVGRGDRIYDVRTFVAPDASFKLSDISFDDITTTLGKPASIKTAGSDQVLTYNTGKNTLKFVGPSSTKKLDHISIFNQKSSEPMGGRN